MKVTFNLWVKVIRRASLLANVVQPAIIIHFVDQRSSEHESDLADLDSRMLRGKRFRGLPH